MPSPRLAAPTRLVGREDEVAALRAVFADVLTGERRGVLVSGPAGVGKTTLLDALRPLVAAHNGWFTAGQFDQYRQDEDTDGLRLAFRTLLRQLLAEPEDEIARFRRGIATVVGSNLSLAAAVLPELATMMRVTPEAPDRDSPALPARLHQAALDLARAVSSPRRPIVMVLDDLQRAPAHRLELVDALMTDESLAGLLVVGGYRTGPERPEPLFRERRLGTPPLHLELANLPPAALGTLVADLLRIEEPAAAPLADTIAGRTDGNPYDTIELINALRRDGALVPGLAGWQWDADELGRYAGRQDVLDLLAARFDKLPAATVDLLEIMAGLGGEVELQLLAVAAGLGEPTAEAHLRPALEDGLLLRRPGDDRLRFRHDRVQQAAFDRPDAAARTAHALTVARRVAGRPGFGSVAAEQYLLAKDAITDPGERRRAAELLRDAARRAELLADNELVERLTTAGLELAGDRTAELVLDLLTMRHAALVRAARFDAADEVFARIAASDAPAIALTPATWAQINSLHSRQRLADAVALGLDQLAKLGHPYAEYDGRAVEELAAFAGAGDEATDRQRSEVDDPRILAVARTIDRLITPAFVSDPAVHAWLLTQAAEIWSKCGPMAALMSALSHAIFVTDARVGQVITRRVVAVGAARGYEPETAGARLLYAVSIGHWFEPLEDNVPRAQEARERLLQGGDPLSGAYTYYSILPNLLDCSSTLGSVRPEVEAGFELASRLGNPQFRGDFASFREFIRALQGEADTLTDPSSDDPFAFHPLAALAAAIAGDVDAMGRHARAAAELWPYIRLNYLAVYIQLVRALALAAEARATGNRDGLAELDSCRDWFAERAADAPDNLRHLLHFVVAERAWATDTPAAASRAFDAALRDVARVHRPWHRALIAEHAAQFHMAYGMRYVGEQLLREARQHYAAWGATAKVAELDRQYPALPRAGTATAAAAGADLDLRSVLAASRALSSETSVERLQARVAATLGAMTGATEVRVVLRDPDTEEWQLHVNGAPAVPLKEAGLPLTPLRYVEQTGEPLVLDDAPRDERFARDPYLAGLEHCSLLVVPVLVRGRTTAILMLENRLGPGAFTGERVEAVLLVAAQLAVSLDNAQLYAALERTVEERTAALAVANERLERLSVTDPLTGLANRRRLSDVVDSEWWRAVRPRLPLAIGVIDVDHFTAYNDGYGHLAGDRCLQRIAAAISECVRTMDLVARYGGESFAVVLPTVDEEVGQIIAERIRDAVIALEEPHERSPFGFVTVSVGLVSVVPSWDGNPQALMDEADQRLSLAKQRGRNLVVAG